MRFPNKEMLEFLHREYPSGTRVVLIRMDDLQAPPLGTKGTVTGVDGHGLPSGGVGQWVPSECDPRSRCGSKNE